ncbi:DUF488 domain-containing protein [Meiothermus luteus]|uniref:DUF488 domain-containing protein n=1 Tax=Meiothermus luteus TaxID=2026184 RepID=UPI001C70E223|nr:DUF488 domain-containing protein [Meiothermus luteus]
MALTKIYTVGFTHKTAEQFFELLRRHGVRRLLDVRLNNTSQLAGFSKKADLAYFLKQILGADYLHEPLLAPTEGLLKAYQKGKISWAEYEAGFLSLMRERRVEQRVDRGWFSRPTVLLCSEPTPERCHRRLVAEYLAQRWGDLEVVHL